MGVTSSRADAEDRVTRMDAATVAQLRTAVSSRLIVAAYRRRVMVPADASECHTWTGPDSPHGQTSFWIGTECQIAAHVFGYAVAYGVDALLAAPGLAHACRNPLCQNVEHVGMSVGDEG